MEIEKNLPLVAKKVWKTLRIVLFMLSKGIAKSKMVAELNLLLKRGKVAAVKAIANTLTLRHHSTAASFVSPHDYEFSCSNSPAVIKLHSKIKNHRHHHHHHHHHDNDFSTVQKVLEILNDVDAASFSSPSPMVTFPGFGKSPIGRKIRITDSPFPLKEEEGDDHSHVDVAAEEFIKRFYRNLNLQQKLTAIQSPYNNSRDR